MVPEFHMIFWFVSLGTRAYINEIVKLYMKIMYGDQGDLWISYTSTRLLFMF